MLIFYSGFELIQYGIYFLNLKLDINFFNESTNALPFSSVPILLSGQMRFTSGMGLKSLDTEESRISHVGSLFNE